MKMLHLKRKLLSITDEEDNTKRMKENIFNCETIYIIFSIRYQ